MTVTITNIYNITDKLISIKVIIPFIEIYIFAPERIKSSMLLFFSWSSKQSVDNIIHLNMMFILCIFKDIFPNVRYFTYHPTSYNIISIDMFLPFILQARYDKKIFSEYKVKSFDIDSSSSLSSSDMFHILAGDNISGKNLW